MSVRRIARGVLGALVGVVIGSVAWATQAGAGGPDAAYTAVTPCVVFDSRPSQGASDEFLGPINGEQAVTYTVTGAFPAAQGGGAPGSACGVPIGATSVEINVVAVNALNEGNVKATDGSPVSTGGVVNYSNLTPKLNTSNAVIVPLSAAGQIVVTPNCGPGCTDDTTDVRGVVLGYFSTGLADRMAAAEAKIAALETKLAGVSRTTHNGLPTIQLSGVNLQIINGGGNTYGSSNGRGNLILGYDTNPNALARTGSHNLIIGNNHGWSGDGGAVFGGENVLSADAATITGGSANTASGVFSSVTGGRNNTAGGRNSSVSGGESNTADGADCGPSPVASSVSGGQLNHASACFASVTGGSTNLVTGESGLVAGGLSNTASGLHSVVAGGAGNQASGVDASVSGGHDNVASGDDSSVSGGAGVDAAGVSDWRAGTLFEPGPP